MIVAAKQKAKTKKKNILHINNDFKYALLIRLFVLRTGQWQMAKY